MAPADPPVPQQCWSRTPGEFSLRCLRPWRHDGAHEHDGLSWVDYPGHLDESCRELAAMNSPVPAALDAQIEALAEYAHAAWSGWMRYLFSRCGLCIDAETGAEDQLIPAEWAQRWTRQMNTPYADLSEREKESDRNEARKILAALRAAGPRRTPDG